MQVPLETRVRGVDRTDALDRPIRDPVDRLVQIVDKAGAGPADDRIGPTG